MVLVYISLITTKAKHPFIYFLAVYISSLGMFLTYPLPIFQRLLFLIYMQSFGERNGNPLQYSCLENPMDRGAWQTMVHGVTKSLT